MVICVHVACDGEAHGRGLCKRHYGQLLYRASREPRSTVLTLVERCQAGLNQDCVDCGARPLFGGRRCHDCFLLRRDARRGPDEHRFYGEPATVRSYQRGCRCADCRKASAESQSKYRKARR